MVLNVLTDEISGKQSLSAVVTSGAETEEAIRQERPNLYKSFLATRLLVGIVGVALPTFILVWDLTTDALAERPLSLRGSLSAYYYHASPLRDWFVGSLWAIGVGLMVYMGTRKSSIANGVSWAAGLAALVVALFPTNEGGTPATWVSALHFGAAAVVIIGLGLLCVGFGVYDHNRTDTDTVWKKLFWIHHLAALVIFCSVVLVVLNRQFGIWPSHGVLAAEIAAVYAFSLSWFAKGWELFEYNRKNPANAAGAPAN